MRVAIIGGGPGGLFTGILLKTRGVADEVTVFERNASDDTFGFGIVFSDETFDNLEAADPVGLSAVAAEFRQWTDIDIHRNGRTWRSTGHGFSAMSRLRFLQLLADRATEVGVDIRFKTEIRADEPLPDTDLIIGADGANSGIRQRFADRFRPRVGTGRARYAWFGTEHVFDSFTFIFTKTRHGIFQAHCYPYTDQMSTLIVETSEEAWLSAGLDATATRQFLPGESDEEAMTFTESLFRQFLGGKGLIGNNSKWLRFPRIVAQAWHHENIVLLGDAAHTAHYSIGSGTKLAMEDAIALVDSLEGAASLPAALADYETNRRPLVDSIQRAAATSRRWFEAVDRYTSLDDEQFVFQLLTRSQRITYDNLRLRDPKLVTGVTRWFHDQAPDHLRPNDADTPPMFYPYELRGMRLANRIVVSPMAQYSAVDGFPNEWHLVHLGSRAVGGACMVVTEMTCVSPDARITPGCTGLWNEEQRRSWTEIVEFVHKRTPAKIAIQIGHAGRKGSTQVPWEAEDRDDVPLPQGNWQLLGPSALPWRTHSQAPRAMTQRDMDRVRDDHVSAATLAAAAGFDMLEIHMAHGYLLSSFLSPLTNRRDDEFGGSIENRARFPLEIFDAVRQAWPADRPMSVRISATDWIAGGNTGDEAVSLARLFQAHGCDILDVSSGQVHPDQQPDYGRLYQTPYSDRIRQETGMPTMTVGAVSSIDDVNTILLSGRADLCLMARPHLVDPYWTLNAAIDQGYAGHPWPEQYLAGMNARRREQDATARIEP